MDLKKNEYIADFFGRLNAGEKVDDKPENNPEVEKLKYFWENCSPGGGFDSSSIIEKTRAKIAQERRKRQRRYVIAASSVAASFLIFVAGTFFLTRDKGAAMPDLQAIVRGMEDKAVEEVTLIVEEKQLNLDEGAVVSYTKEGKIAVNSNEVEEVNEGTKEKEALEYNKLLVPAGKRATIELSDGSRLTVNALSKVVYPRRFSKNVREIYVQGEVFLDVAHDEKRPFIVSTDDFDLRVLGTRFNISNYKALGAANVVLVEGSVEVTDKRENKTVLRPNDLLSVTDGAITGQEQVDVSSYISWVDGLVILRGENLSRILKKLNIYYGTEIEYLPEIADVKMYGKLDLKEDLTEVLNTIREIVSAETGNGDTGIRLRERNKKIG